MSYDKFLTLGISPAPKPFPGKYPTRISIVGPSLPYVGKPVTGLLHWLRESFLRKGGRIQNLTIQEFDQNGIIRQTVGGGGYLEATFANTYFPMPSFYRDFCGRNGFPYMMLDRELVEVQGKRLYRNCWWKNSPDPERFQRMMRDCARGRVTGDWFNWDQAEIAYRASEPLVSAWVAPTPPRVDQVGATPTHSPFFERLQRERESRRRARELARQPLPTVVMGALAEVAPTPAMEWIQTLQTQVLDWMVEPAAPAQG